jgi:hypothetical protein
MPLEGKFCLQNLFLVLVSTISLSRFTQTKEEIGRVRLTSSRQETFKFGANATRHLLSRSLCSSIVPNADRAQVRRLGREFGRSRNIGSAEPVERRDRKREQTTLPEMAIAWSYLSPVAVNPGAMGSWSAWPTSSCCLSQISLGEIHPHAEHAAETAEFAAANGSFREMHDLLYENQTTSKMKPFSGSWTTWVSSHINSVSLSQQRRTGRA